MNSTRKKSTLNLIEACMDKLLLFPSHVLRCGGSREQSPTPKQGVARDGRLYRLNVSTIALNCIYIMLMQNTVGHVRNERWSLCVMPKPDHMRFNSFIRSGCHNSCLYGVAKHLSITIVGIDCQRHRSMCRIVA